MYDQNVWTSATFWKALPVPVKGLLLDLPVRNLRPSSELVQITAYLWRLTVLRAYARSRLNEGGGTCVPFAILTNRESSSSGEH